MKVATASFQVHRWIGLAFGIFGLMWFASVVLMSLFPYWDRPTQPALLRAYGPPLVAADLDAQQRVPDRTPDGEAVRTALLHRIDNELTWQLESAKRRTVVLSAATGEPRALMSPEAAGRMAGRTLGGNTAPRRIEQLSGTGDAFYSTARRNENPPYRVSFDDANSTDVYLDPVTGEVLRLLGRREKIYRLGRMPHLLRFPPFDDNGGLSQAVRLAGLTGLAVATVAGLIYGMWLTFWRQRATGRGWLATSHLWLGLALFPILLLWIGSGFVMLLSDSSLAPSAKETAPLRGKSIRAAEFKVSPQDALRAATEANRQPIMALQAGRLLDKPVYQALHADGHATIVDGSKGAVFSPLPEHMIRDIALRFAGENATVEAIDRLDAYDFYYYKLKRSDPLPLPVFRVSMKAAANGADIPTSVYIDAYSGDVRGRVNRAEKIDRWFARLPHTFATPWTLAHPTVRALMVAIPGTLATLLAVSGLWMGLLYLFRLAFGRRGSDLSALAVTEGEVR